jgi:hypothetical protein
VSVEVPLRQFQYWSAAEQQWLVAGGRRAVYVGDADSAGRLALEAAVDIPSHANVTCDDAQLSATMVSGRLTVPRGSWCDLVDVSVAGDARIGGTGVRIAGSTIGGNLDILGTQDAADPLSAQTNIVAATRPSRATSWCPAAGSRLRGTSGSVARTSSTATSCSPATTPPATRSRATPSIGTWCALTTATSRPSTTP